MKDKTPAADGPLTDGPALDALASEAATMAPPADGAAPAGDVAAQADAIPSGELCKMVLGPLFAIFAPNWNVTATEVDQLGNVYGAVLDKYFPGGLGEFGPEITACLITCAVIAPRANKPRKLEARRDTSRGTDQGAADAPTG